jgi:kynurenine formamidase
LGLTHIDAPCHTIFKGQIYNGHSASQIQTAAGALVGSIELASDGVVGRAVLLDVPASQGRKHLDDGEAVFPDDLDRCEELQQVRVRSGDILLVRTGYRLHSPRGPATRAGGYPGLQASCLPWLRERDVALLATDTAADVHPNDYAMGMPIHTVGMWAMGLWLVDNCSFEQLALECASRGRWEMLFMIAPLTLSAATGSPINPLAVF